MKFIIQKNTFPNTKFIFQEAIVAPVVEAGGDAGIGGTQEAISLPHEIEVFLPELMQRVEEAIDIAEANDPGFKSIPSKMIDQALREQVSREEPNQLLSNRFRQTNVVENTVAAAYNACYGSYPGEKKF